MTDCVSDEARGTDTVEAYRTRIEALAAQMERDIEDMPDQYAALRGGLRSYVSELRDLLVEPQGERGTENLTVKNWQLAWGRAYGLAQKAKAWIDKHARHDVGCDFLNCDGSMRPHGDECEHPCTCGLHDLMRGTGGQETPCPGIPVSWMDQNVAGTLPPKHCRNCGTS